MAATEEILLVHDEAEQYELDLDACGPSRPIRLLHSTRDLFEHLKKVRPALIFIDAYLPDVDGHEPISVLKMRPQTRDVPVIALTAKHDDEAALNALSCGAADYLAKSYVSCLLPSRVNLHLENLRLRRQVNENNALLEEQKRRLEDCRKELQRLVDLKTGKVFELQSGILRTVANLVESRDGCSVEHLMQQQRDMDVLMESLHCRGLFKDLTEHWNTDLILQSALLHDVGKIGIQDSILHKPDKLTPEEYETVKKHAALGVDLLKRIEGGAETGEFLRFAKIFAGAHHERWDGSGYPLGLKGQEIPLAGRLMSIVDVYDSLTTDRPYKKAFVHNQAVEIILSERGRQFDPTLVDVFSQIADHFKFIPN
jgi:putative two-component system response regulator